MVKKIVFPFIKLLNKVPKPDMTHFITNYYVEAFSLDIFASLNSYSEACNQSFSMSPNNTYYFDLKHSSNEWSNVLDLAHLAIIEYIWFHRFFY